MQWYQYVSLIALIICFLALLGHFLRLIKHGNPKDLSDKSGNISKAEVYSYTKAMLPTQKESAYLHIPSFASGIFFHISSFVSLLLFIVFFFIFFRFNSIQNIIIYFIFCKYFISSHYIF